MIETQTIQIPEFQRLRGEKAIEALQDFVRELKEHGSEELTDKQTKALIKFAKGLISSIEAENKSNVHTQQMKEETHSITRLKKIITKYIPERASFPKLK